MEKPNKEVGMKGGMTSNLQRTQDSRAPVGDCRLMINIRREVHRKLKMAAARRGTTMGDLIEKMLEQQL